MATQDGNGWVNCRCGLRHWGLHGAAGLALVDLDLARPGPAVLLQLRADWTHQGGTWGLPGGARDSHEDVVVAALREAHEEVGVDTLAVEVLALHVGADHGDWRYTYVLGVTRATPTVRVMTSETDELRWVGLEDVASLPLHPGLAQSWADLHRRLTVVVPQARSA